MFKKIRSYFTLNYLHSCFTDTVSGELVCMYVDCYGDMYLKNGRWSLFRVYKGNMHD